MHVKIVEDFGDLDWGEPQGWDNRLRSKTEPHAAEAGWPPRAVLVVQQGNLEENTENHYFFDCGAPKNVFEPYSVSWFYCCSFVGDFELFMIFFLFKIPFSIDT